MRLADPAIGAALVRWTPTGWSEVTLLADADGVTYWCPKCNGEHGRRRHICVSWFAGKGAPADEIPLPGRWPASGTTIADLTLTGSILQTKCGWHGYFRAGEVLDA